MLHHIQRSIIDRLGTNEFLRYGQLKPRELDGNVFGYHLKQLISAKLVHKDESEYRLTAEGREYFTHRFENPLFAAHPILLMVVRSGGSYILRERSVQPLIGRIGFIHGEPVAGEAVELTASRRIRDKTGLEVDFTVHGSALISQYSGDDLVSYSMAIILCGSTELPMKIEQDETGRNLLANDLRIQDILPSCQDIQSMIEDGTSWAELTYRL